MSIVEEGRLLLYDPSGHEDSIVGVAFAPALCALMAVGSKITAQLNTPQKAEDPRDSGYLVLAWLVHRLLQPKVLLSDIIFKISDLRQHVVHCLEHKTVTEFPSLPRSAAHPATSCTQFKAVNFVRLLDSVTIRTSTFCAVLPPLMESQVLQDDVFLICYSLCHTCLVGVSCAGEANTCTRHHTVE